eukprot:g45490.t1
MAFLKRSELGPILYSSDTFFSCNYGNQIDGISKPAVRKKKGGRDTDEEESELLQNSSEDEVDDDGDVEPVSCTPPMKPVITDSKEFDRIPHGDMISKFADDTKIGGAVNSKEGYPRVQRVVDQMGQWTKEWQLKFNLDKCEVLHFGK